MYKNIIIRDNTPYNILNIISRSAFIDKNGSINKKVLGLYVNQWKADRVLETEGKFLICKIVEDAQTED